jgi:hypothetical protein
MRVGNHVESFDHAIRPGVVLFLGDTDDSTERVQLSSGTIAAPDATPAGQYEDGARIPRPKWRNLTTADRQTLIAQSCPESYGTAISVVRLPPQLLEPFASLRDASAECRSEKELSPIINSKNCTQGTDAVIAHLQQHFQHPDGRALGAFHMDRWIDARPPGLPSVTAEGSTGALVGLHVDSWSRLDYGLSYREHAPNRVCVNLASEDRFFLFLNIPIGQIYELMKDETAKSLCASRPSVAATEFMRSFPFYPVVRVRIRPGEAYIAPPENIAHDGSSINKNAMDVTLSIRGRFTLCPTKLACLHR